MDKIGDLFAPLIGQSAWNVSVGYGTFLTMEFGLPHLVVREPKKIASTRSKAVQQAYKRRHVSLVGDWHFWIQYAEWRVSSSEYFRSIDKTSAAHVESRNISGYFFGRRSFSDPAMDICLGDLDGQKLISIAEGSRKHSTICKFDLGSTLEIWPSEEISAEQWSLYHWNGDIASYQHDGALTFEKAESRTP